MVVMYLNVKGLMGAPKLQAFKNLIKASSPHVILLQETLCSRKNAKETLAPWITKWSFLSLNLKGIFIGFITAWNPSLETISTNLVESKI